MASHQIVAVRELRDAAGADIIKRPGPHQAVGCGNRTGDAAGAAAEGNRPDVGRRGGVPARAYHHIVAVRERRDAGSADTIVRRRAHQAVQTGDHCTGRSCARYETIGAVDPGGRPGVGRRTVVPARAYHHIVTVRERRDAAVADTIERRRAHQTVRGGNRAGDAADSAAEGDRPDVGRRTVVPVRAVHHIVAVVERRDAADADSIIRRRAHQAVRRGDRTGDAGGAAAEGDRPRLGRRAVDPVRAGHHIIAVREHRDAAPADPVTRRRPHQAVGGGDSARHAARAAAEGNRPGVERRTVGPALAHHQIVAVREHPDTGRAHPITRRRAHQAVRRGHRTGDACGAAAEGDRPAVGRHRALASHHIVAVREHRHAP